MTRTLTAALTFSAALLTAGMAAAQTCPAPPTAPAESARPVRPGAPPAKPGCVDEANKAHNCKSGVVAAYSKAVEDYNAAITKFNDTAQAYVAALNAYAQGAHDYAHCQVQILAGKAGG